MNELTPHQEILQKLEDCISTSTNNSRMIKLANNQRFCRWDGQSDDGRKHEEDIGTKPVPFEGCSDARIRLSDKIANEHVRLTTESLFRSKVDIGAVELSDGRKASPWETVFNWLLQQKLAQEISTQAEVMGQIVFGEHPGVGVMGVYWKRKVQLEATRLDRQLLTKLFMLSGVQNEEQMEQAHLMVQDPAQEPQVLEMARKMFPQVKPKILRKALREYRKEGETIIPTPTITMDQPCVRAYRLWDDIYFDYYAEDLQTTDVFILERLKKQEVEELEHTENVSREFIDEVLKHPTTSRYDSYNNMYQDRFDQGTDRNEEEYHIYYAYTHDSDDDGVPGIFRTILHREVSELDGGVELLQYNHGRMPFIEFTRERLSQAICDSRSIPEICLTNQVEIKIQRDTRANAVQIATFPPTKVHTRRQGLETIIAPFAQIEVHRQDDIEPMKIATAPQGSIEMEERSLRDAEDYFGGDGSDPQKKALYNQFVANKWLRSWAEVFKQMFALCQQYWKPEFLERITNRPAAEFAVDPADIVGGFDMILRFNAENLFPELVEKKLEMIAQLIVPLDINNTIKRNQLIKLALEMLDPQMSDLLVESDQEASAREVSEEQIAWVQIALGIEPQFVQQANHQLRLQVADKVIKTSPEVQEQLKSKPLIMEMAKARVQNLRFGIEQQRNAQRGKDGAKSPLEQEVPNPLAAFESQQQPQQPQLA